jgi:hypothetical protein
MMHVRRKEAFSGNVDVDIINNYVYVLCQEFGMRDII